MAVVWDKIKEAIESCNSPFRATDIKSYVASKWPSDNLKTIDAQLQIYTVNHQSRVNYDVNKIPRKTDSASQYDQLYKIERGLYEKYNLSKHGIWEIFLSADHKIKVRKTKKQEYQYSPDDILWFKSVTNSEHGQAYLNLNEDKFILNFPLKHRTNILSPKKNEIILIYQKVDGVPSFTHLVTPIQKGEVDENIRPEYRYGRWVKVIAKTSKENAIKVSSTAWNNIRLSGITQGNACKIENIKNLPNIELLKFDIWQQFKPHFINQAVNCVEDVSSIISNLESNDSDFSVTEGGLKLVSHIVKERNRKIIQEKKRIASQQNNMNCEVCKFSFIDTYNSNYIECHHIAPIASGGVRKTKLEDLALVCSNCHRMLHQKFDGCYLSIDGLRDRMCLK